MNSIKNVLEKERRNLFIAEHMVTDIRATQPVTVKITSYEKEDRKFLLVNKGDPAGESSKAYFLPWRSDTGYSIDLPAQEPSSDLFFTDGLSGCCVGVQQLPGVIRVCHYNIQGEVFSREDFERYNKQNNIRNWLLPQKYEDQLAGMEAFYYPPVYQTVPGTDSWTYFWGEYHSGGWQFYYQIPDGTISPLNY